MRRSRLRGLGVALAALLAALALVPLLTGHPLVSYPVSRSMEPTIGAFDVFLVDPFPGAIRVGDVIVFESQTQGGPAVHRVIGGSEAEGWFTQGDANANVDQIGAEPPVTRDRLLGRVVTGPSGAPILLRDAGIPIVEARAEWTRLSNRVGGSDNLASILLVALAASFAVPAFFAKRNGARPHGLPSRASRRALRKLFPRGIQGRHVALALLLVVAASAMWGAHRAHLDARTSLIVVSDPTLVDPVRTVTPGGSVDREIEVSSLGFLPTLVVLDPGSAGIVTDGAHATTGPWGKVSLHVREVGGEALGHQVDVVSVWRYPDAMPRAWALALHGALPGAPYLAIAGSLALVGYAWYAAMGVARKPVGGWLGMKEGWL